VGAAQQFEMRQTLEDMVGRGIEEILLCLGTNLSGFFGPKFNNTVMNLGDQYGSLFP
jgi:hypothetical protein